MTVLRISATRLVGAVFSLIIAATSISCASSPYAPKETDILKLVALINAGSVNDIDGLAQTPFALDTEILYLESDVTTLWANLQQASFKINDPKKIEANRVESDTWSEFAPTFDMKNFFEKYTGKNTALVKLESAEGTYTLLLEPKLKGYPRIRGIKGPVK